ncbi:MAG: hypothetical protein ACOVQA_02130, partial [Thermoflexibacteraceae bacterium]
MKRLSFLYSYKVIVLVLLFTTLENIWANPPQNGLTPADLEKIKGLETKIKEDSVKLQQFKTQLESLTKENKTLEAANAQLSLDNNQTDSFNHALSAYVYPFKNHTLGFTWDELHSSNKERNAKNAFFIILFNILFF